jgi:cell wall-active antibiotic response 4TMS protein YvqF/B-box zinc finger protein
MKCAVHPEADATGYCRNCGKAMCSACARPVRDVLYCEDCLAGIMGIPGAHPAGASGAATAAPDALPPTSAGAAASAAPRHEGNPGLAFVLGFLFPGLGAVYNGEYNKALIHIVVFATMILGLSSDLDGGFKAVLGILLAGFIFYMAFDSMRTAQAQRRGEVIVDPLESWSKGRPVGPIILIAVGALFLLNNFDLFPFYRIERFWPLILIAIGVLMFRNRLGSRS